MGFLKVAIYCAFAFFQDVDVLWKTKKNALEITL